MSLNSALHGFIYLHVRWIATCSTLGKSFSPFIDKSVLIAQTSLVTLGKSFRPFIDKSVLIAQTSLVTATCAPNCSRAVEL